MPTLRKELSKIRDYPAHLEQCWQEHLAPRAEDAPTVISTFAGCGGSSLGYSMAGFRELLAVEWDDNAVQTFRSNFPHVPVHHGDIGKVSADDVLRMTSLQAGQLDLFDGSPPCQGFSTSGKRVMDDPRNQLFREYVRLLKGLQPKTFVMENVSGMVKGKMKLIFAEILRALRDCGYQASARLLDTSYFGVPQSRQRMIFIGVRSDLGILPSHPKGLIVPIAAERAIGDLPVDDLCMLNPEMTRLWNRCRPGKLFSTVHPKGNYFNTCKADPNRPFRTITKTTYAEGGSGICHWDKPGLISIPMLKRAGSFPGEFQFFGKFREQWARIGNSVPPLFMRFIALHIRSEILSKCQ